MKTKKVIKYTSRFKKIVDETLLKNIPPVVLFDLYDLNDDQLHYLLERVKSIYNLDENKDEELESFYIPDRDRNLKGYNLNFLFHKLVSAKNDGLTQEYQNIREEILTRNINLVKDSIKVLFKDIAIPKEDAMICGIEGLFDAIDSYQIESGNSFYTYAISQIVLNIQKHFAELTGITYEEYKKGVNIPNVPNRVAKIDSPIVIGNQIESMSITFEDYEEQDEQEDRDLIPYGTEEVNFDHKELNEIIEESLSKLTPLRRKAVEQYFGLDGNEPLNYTEIAKIENRSVTQAKNRVTYGLWDLKKIINKSKLEGYIKDQDYNSKQEKIKKSEQQILMYTRVCELLQYSISEEAFPNFMRMAGFDLSSEEVLKLVNDIDKISRLTDEYSLNFSTLYEKSKDIIEDDEIRARICQIICHSKLYYISIRCGISQFNDNYKLFKRKK